MQCQLDPLSGAYRHLTESDRERGPIRSRSKMQRSRRTFAVEERQSQLEMRENGSRESIDFNNWYHVASQLDTRYSTHCEQMQIAS